MVVGLGLVICAGGADAEWVHMRGVAYGAVGDQVAAAVGGDGDRGPQPGGASHGVVGDLAEGAGPGLVLADGVGQDV